MAEDTFSTILSFLRRVPGIEGSIGHKLEKDGRWWLKFSIDIEHPLAWHVVQELGNVLNYLSWNERLPTVFMPVSPPSYLNGGPADSLSWVVECNDASFLPSECAEWLEGRLPNPVDDLTEWKTEDESGSWDEDDVDEDEGA